MTTVLESQSATWSAEGSDFLLKSSASNGELYVAGYASVDMVDKQGDRIPVDALKKAFGQFMGNKAFRNVQLAHSGIQVGEVVDSHTDSQGRVWKSEVDNHGLFVVCKIRNDIQKAREVQKQIRNGDLRAFSIGGQALFRVSKTTPELGSHREITDLELHEITLCKKGINPESTYTILKMEGETDMTNSEMLKEIKDGLNNVLSELTKGDDKEEKEEKAYKGAYKGEMKEMKEEKEMKEMKKGEEDALAYIETLEKFAHDSGVDLNAVRDHFGLEKAYMLEQGQGGYSHRGQGDEIGSGEDATEPAYPALPSPSGNQYVIKSPSVPSMGMNAPSGNANVIKQLTPETLEKGYRTYAALRDEEALKGLVEKEWKERYDAETQEALEVRKANDVGLQLDALRNEIASLKSNATDISKSDNTPSMPSTQIRVPTHEEFAQMGSDLEGWRAAEALAQRALRGE
jgi:HK97 family phage prohead protease